MVFGGRGRESYHLESVEFSKAAAVLANFFTYLPETKAIGLFGSLARKLAGKETAVSDVDLVVFNDGLYRQLSGEKHSYPFHLERNLRSLPLAEIQRETLKALVGYFGQRGITFDVHIFPVQLDAEFITAISKNNPDQLFLRKLSGDMLFWQSAKGVFEKDDQLWQEFFGQLALEPGVRVEVVSGLKQAGEGSVLLLRENGLTVALDCGANPINGSPAAVREQTERTISRLLAASPTQVVITHFHYDHWGLLPSYLKRLEERRRPWPTIVATDQTFAFIREYLARERSFLSGIFGWGQTLNQVRSTEQIELIPANHSVPGSTAVLFRGAKNLFYSGDCWSLDLPANLPPVELLIMDSTNALKEESRDPAAEGRVRENIVSLVKETLRQPKVKAYLALFSTQLERASQLFSDLCFYGVFIKGASLFRNWKAFQQVYSQTRGYRVVFLTGVWAQGESTETESALVRLSRGQSLGHGLGGEYRQIQKGDLVILSARIPLWSSYLTEQIGEMCGRLSRLGARVIVDQSAPSEWESFVDRREVHQGGHGNWPEIQEVIRRVGPKKILPFHANSEARQKVASFCRENGFEVIPEKNLPVLSI